MLEEPFWLGLIAVTCVMTTIGICYLFKKHLPDKFDKMLTPSVDQLKNPTTEGQTGKWRATINNRKLIYETGIRRIKFKPCTYIITNVFIFFRATPFIRTSRYWG